MLEQALTVCVQVQGLRPSKDPAYPGLYGPVP